MNEDLVSRCVDAMETEWEREKIPLDLPRHLALELIERIIQLEEEDVG